MKRELKFWIVIGLILLALALFAVRTGAYNYQVTHNPYTGKLDFHVTSNFSNYTIIADSFEGNGSLLNVNGSDYWDSYDVAGDILFSDLNWNFGNDWNYIDSGQWYFNDSKLSTKYYNVTSIQTLEGIGTGTLSDIQVNDGNAYNITEVNSAPGFDFRANFTGVNEFNQLYLRTTTNENQDDTVAIQLYDYETKSWITQNSFTYLDDYNLFEIGVFDGKYINDSKVQFRLYQEAKGKTSEIVYIDWIALANGYGTPSADDLYYLQELSIDSTNINDTIKITDGNGNNISEITINDNYEADTNFTGESAGGELTGAYPNPFVDSMNWSGLKEYPSACPEDTYLTQLGDSVTCTGIDDIWVDESGDTMTGDLTLGSDDDVCIDGANCLSQLSDDEGAADNAFYAYDANGNIDVTGGWTDITFDTEVRENSAYTHTSDSAVVTVNNNAWYQVTAQCFSETTVGRDSAQWRLVKDSGSGYSEISGTRAGSYHRTDANDESTATVNAMLNLNSGDKIKFQGSGDGGVFTAPNGCRIRMTVMDNNGAYNDTMWNQTGSDVYYNSGNVGVGTSTPNKALNVVGDINATGYLYVSSTAYPSRYSRFYSGASQGISATNDFRIGPDGAIVLQSGDKNNKIEIQNDAGSKYVSFKGSSESVGIGTDSPDRKFHVQNSGNTWMTVDSASSGNDQGYLMGVDGTWKSSVRWDDTNNILSLGTSGGNSDALNIDTSDRVGIGTTSPDQKLVVNPGSNKIIKLGDETSMFDDTDYTWLPSDVSTTYGAIGFESGSGAIEHGIVSYNDGANDNLLVKARNSIQMGTNGNDAGFYLDAAGDVGIGTTNPVSALNVDGSSGPVIGIDNVGSVDGTSLISFQEGDDSLGEFRFESGFAGSGDANYLELRSAGTDDIMSWQYGGNVGIGTTSPGETLDVAGGIETNYLTDGSGRSSDYWSGDADISVGNFIYTSAILHEGEAGGSPAGITFGSGNTEGSDQVSIVTSGITRLFADSSGNVGIGTTDPSYKLEVDGTVDAAGFTEGGSSTLSNSITGDADTVDGNDASAFVSTSGDDMTGTLDMQSSGDVNSVNNLNVGTINSNNGANPIHFHQGFTVDAADGGGGGITIEQGNLDVYNDILVRGNDIFGDNSYNEDPTLNLETKSSTQNCVWNSQYLVCEEAYASYPSCDSGEFSGDTKWNSVETCSDYDDTSPSECTSHTSKRSFRACLDVQIT